jgi:5-methylcytosine-specific restriction protein A
MNQGVTDLKREFGAGVSRQMLSYRAKRLRARADQDLPDHFRLDAISLQPPDPSHLLASYEAGHAFGPCYTKGALPTEEELNADVATMLRIYRLLAARGGTDDLADQETDGADKVAAFEESRRYRYHRTFERNAGLARAAKQVHGFVCQCCGFDFESVYGELGHEYIEAHHLVPLASMDGDGPVSRSPEHDFRVLCSNCHRMIHRLIRKVGGPVSIEMLRKSMVG